jgi:phosphoenolpyruvate carboxykinase (ATP)
VAASRWRSPAGLSALANVAFAPDPIFGILVPTVCPGVPSKLLRPRDTWADPAEYDRQARMLAELFRRNFKEYEADVGDEVRRAGPSPLAG